MSTVPMEGFNFSAQELGINEVHPTKYPCYFFFYGPWMCSTAIERIFHNGEFISSRKAEITGYEVAQWGYYPALIKAEEGQRVSGYAAVASNAAMVHKLEFYESNGFKIVPVQIKFLDQEEGSPNQTTEGYVFLFDGDMGDLKKLDREQWLAGMKSLGFFKGLEF
ncbi:hypothetical protein FQN57_006269 [Myotisia sp. PD_48]|nr:hypothetical protein FQN57_006269 [Myotisia sp. PD_48]